MRQQPWPSASEVTRSENAIQGTSRTSTVRNTTRSCSTLLWERLCSSACGTESGVAVRKMAVPGTRYGGALYSDTGEALRRARPPPPPLHRTSRPPPPPLLLVENPPPPAQRGQPPPAG